jgi:hypothetical protein
LEAIVIETRPKTKKKQKSEGCHCSDPKPDGTCCNLVCFERPNYFCGHLLTDADLSKEQQYVVEKNKLYHRTLHGWGIVCGLRLTCGDEECCGSIVIDEGYAIDDCGNDLVVCEPRRFDVVSLLREKGYIVGDAAYDPCLPEDEQEECEYTQCFYVTACYEEEASDFTTPFVAGCRPTLTECEPTRIREGVRFDVVDELPEETSWLRELIERLSGCFSVFTTGPFSRALNDPEKLRLMERVCSNPDNIEGTEFDGYKDLFCELRGLLLLYFQKHPDKYNCKLTDEIRRNVFPDNPRGATIKDAFSNLLRLAFQHAISCALGQLVPRCPTPKQAGCVVLGTVEVKGGCVTHVCNCPRKYVWSFANFFQVLLATMYGGLACEEEEEEAAEIRIEDGPAGTGRLVNIPETNGGNGHKRHVCCNEFDATCEDILPLLRIDRKFLQFAGTEAVRAFQVLTKSVRSIFNFTDARMYSPSMFINMKQPAMERTLSDLRIKNFRTEQVAASPEVGHPVEELLHMGLGQFSRSRLVLQQNPDNVVVNAYIEPDFVQAQAPRQDTGSTDLADRVDKAEAAAQAATERAGKLEERLASAEEFIRNVTSAGGITIEEVRRRIQEQLAGSERPESTEVKRRTTKKAAKGGQPQTPEGEGGENG